MGRVDSAVLAVAAASSLASSLWMAEVRRRVNMLMGGKGDGEHEGVSKDSREGWVVMGNG